MTGLERALKQFGATSLKEAIELAKKKKPEPLPVTNVQELLASAIKLIEEKIKHIDYDSLDPLTRSRLAKLPLNTENEVILWRNSWLELLERGKSETI